MFTLIKFLAYLFIALLGFYIQRVSIPVALEFAGFMLMAAGCILAYSEAKILIGYDN